jgi:ribosomal protein S12 methylthiotransferase
MIRKSAEKREGTAGVAGVISLGCSKNLVDTEFLMGGLAGCGWAFSPESEDADLLLVNTCSFLEASVEESRDAIEEAVRWKGEREGRVAVVAGCLVSRFAGELEEIFPGVDLFLLPGQIERLPEWLALPHPRPRRFRGGGPSYLPKSGSGRVVTSPFWAYLKISDGCDNRCSYCLIPQIRGGHRSRTLRSVREEAASLIEAGAREINLIGQDITRWSGGKGVPDLPRLVKSLAALPGDFRLRLLYLHPSRVDERLCRTMAESSKVFPYLDIPIQHASDGILKKMNRPYGRRRLEEMYVLLRRRIPGVALRTTVMVGYPGEGRREFEELLEFLRAHPFENLGSFVFSPEEGTAAASQRKKVSLEEAAERREEVMSLQQELAADLWKGRRGAVTEALILEPLEGEEKACLGRTAWQAPEVDGHVVVRGAGTPGELARVKVTGSGSYDLEGEIMGADRGPLSRSRS